MRGTHQVQRSHMVTIAFLGVCLFGVFGASVLDIRVFTPIQTTTVKWTHVDRRAASPLSSISPAPLAGLVLPLVPPVGMQGLPSVDAHISGIDVDRVRELYRTLGYDLDHIADSQKHVPRVFLASLPSGLHTVRDSDVRKVLFLHVVLPLVLKVNQDILSDRDRLKALLDRQKRGVSLNPRDRQWLDEKSGAYGLTKTDSQELLARLDIVPPSLALAQAAEESGWGTSRFARQGNALFGQWTWDQSKGIRPRNAAADATHAIRRFPTLLAAVRAYMQNLNTHRAYTSFRTQRAALRRRGDSLSGAALANTLTRYSQRGKDYVRSLHVIMQVNDLSQLDDARLSPAPVELADFRADLR